MITRVLFAWNCLLSAELTTEQQVGLIDCKSFALISMPLHPRSPEIEHVFGQSVSQAVPWSGMLYRATSVPYANRLDLLSGKGSQQFGGRWTPPGAFRSVYGSLTPQTAMAESLANYEDYGIPISQAMPLVFVAVSVRLQAVLDVASPLVLLPLGLTINDLTQGGWRAEQEANQEPITQAIGRHAHQAKLEAILVPSSRVPGAQNLVFFPQRRRIGSSIKIQGVRDLPKK